MPSEGILLTFSLPRKNNDQEMNCKISRSQPTTKRAKKFIIQNIKIATTPVVPIPFEIQDVVKITTPNFCSPIIKYQERTTKRNKDQINGQKVQDVKIAPPNGNKRAKISRCQERTT